MSRRRGRAETMEYLAAAERFIRAAGDRVGDADEVELARLLQLHDAVDRAVAAAVVGQRLRGVSWAGIAAGTGTSRQAAQQRYGAAAAAAAAAATVDEPVGAQ
jgi:hypothetical protein